MKDLKFFLDPVTIRIWDQYFKRLGRELGPLDEQQRRELELEMQDHRLPGSVLRRDKSRTSLFQPLPLWLNLHKL